MKNAPQTFTITTSYYCLAAMSYNSTDKHISSFHTVCPYISYNNTKYRKISKHNIMAIKCMSVSNIKIDIHGS